MDYSSDFTLKTFGFSKEMMWAVAIFLGMFFALQMESKMKKKGRVGKVDTERSTCSGFQMCLWDIHSKTVDLENRALNV